MFLLVVDDLVALKNLSTALGSMLGKLEVKIKVTEKALGGKLQRLDLDGDGIVNREELKAAILDVMDIYLNEMKSSPGNSLTMFDSIRL